MKQTITFDFAIGQQVKTPIDQPGTIDAISFDIRGPMYRVIFWYDGNRKSEWLYPWELRP